MCWPYFKYYIRYIAHVLSVSLAYTLVNFINSEFKKCCLGTISNFYNFPFIHQLLNNFIFLVVDPWNFLSEYYYSSLQVLWGLVINMKYIILHSSLFITFSVMLSAFPILLSSKWLSILISLHDKTLVWIFIIISSSMAN